MTTRVSLAHGHLRQVAHWPSTVLPSMGAAGAHWTYYTCYADSLERPFLPHWQAALSLRHAEVSDVPVMASSLDPQAVARISKLPVGFFVAVA